MHKLSMGGYYGFLFYTYVLCMLNTLLYTCTLYLLNYLYFMANMCNHLYTSEAFPLNNSPQNMRGNTSVNLAWSGGLIL